MDLNLGSTRALIDECRRQGLLRNQCAYVLATAFWETARTMKPVREMGGEKYLKSKKYYPYVGMGFVQLTWLKNYQLAEKKLGAPFVKNPKLLLDPKYAVPIAVTGMREGWFTTKKLSDYITLAKSDFVNARRIINGVDKKNEIAKIAREYDMDLKVSGYGEGKPGSVAAAIPVPKPPLAAIKAQQEAQKQFEAGKVALTPQNSTASPQAAEEPHVVLMDGPKKDETTVVVVQTPQNVAQTNPVPTSRTGYAVFGAMIIAAGAAAAKYFGGS